MDQNLKCGVATKLAWGVAGSVSPSSAVDDVAVSITNTSDFNQFIWHGEHSGSGTVQYALRMDNISTGNVYASTFQEDNNNMVDQDGQNGINVSPTAPAVGEHTFMVGYACHTGDEKLCIEDMVFSTGTGAGNIPSKASVVGKTTDTSTIDNISVNNLTTGSDFSSSSRLSVFGSDLTLNATEINFTNVEPGSRFEETDTRKMYNLKEQPTPESTATYQVTDASGTQGLYTGSYYISAEKVKSTSVLVGKRVSKLQMTMYKSNSPTGTATAGVWNSSGELQYTFGTIDVSTLATSFTEYTFNNTDSTHVFSADEYFGIKYQAGSNTNKIIVGHDDASPPFDGTNSVWSRYNGSWSDFDNVDNTFKLYLATAGGTFTWQEIGA